MWVILLSVFLPAVATVAGLGLVAGYWLARWLERRIAGLEAEVARLTWMLDRHHQLIAPLHGARKPVLLSDAHRLATSQGDASDELRPPD